MGKQYLAVWGGEIKRVITTFCACAIAFPCLLISAQQLAKRLILKDGSYQLITQYEVHGDRVHYFSAERNEWEDLPNSMVDWDATTKFEKDRAAGVPAPEAVQLDKEVADEGAAEEARSPEVVTGLRLPEDGEVFLLDTFQAQPQLVELQQNDGQIDRDKKHNVLRAAVNPIAGSKQTFELPGLHAKVQAHVVLPSIYVNLQRVPAGDEAIQAKQASDPSQKADANASQGRFHIVRLQMKQNKRIVADIKVAVYGKVSQQETFVPAKLQQLAGGWIKITPSADMTTGEFALVETMEKSDLYAAIWDFGVNPAAPANSGVLTPEASKPAEDGGKDAGKELQRRKPE